MTWHVITRVGDDDDFEPALADHEPRIFVSLRREGDPHRLGPDVIKDIAKAAGRAPSDPACDLLTVAESAYAADIRIPRHLGLDRWTRRIRLYVPVTNPSLWTSAAARMTRLLAFLTGDDWELVFRDRAMVAAPKTGLKKHTIKTVCLFSGGLDSLVGGIDLLSGDEHVALVGHHGAGLTNSVQQRVLAPLRKKFGGAMHPYMFYVQPAKNKSAGEPTMRARSILFLGLGIAVASSVLADRLVVPENGLISLNVPLTMTRLGSHSTRTTHPHVMTLFSEVLSVLEIAVTVELPYRFQTKGEMLLASADGELLKAVAPLTMSCSHPEVGRYSGKTPGNHCGYCVPCIIRRASLNRAGWPHGMYDNDIVKKPPSKDSDTAADLFAFRMAIERFRGSSHADHVAAVLGTGPIPPGDVNRYAETYARGMSEVAALLSSPRKP